MPLLSSTASREDGGAGSGVHLIHSICAVEDDTLIFAIDSAPGANVAARNSFDAALFSFRKTSYDSSKEAPRRPHSSSSGTSCTGAIRCTLYARSLAGSPRADFASALPEECGACPTCCRRADATDGIGSLVSLPISRSQSGQPCVLRGHSAAAGAVASLSENPSDSLEALRASQLMDLLHRRDADTTAPLATVASGASPSYSFPSLPHPSGDALVALHMVRQEAWQASSDATSTATPLLMGQEASLATVISTDLLCLFDCGCAALATFTLTRHAPPVEWSVQLGGCVWIPSVASPTAVPGRGTGIVRGGVSELTWATGAPIVSSLVRPLPPTVLLAASAEARRDGGKSLLELLIVWCSPTVASSSFTDARPAVRYTSLRCCSGNLPTASTVTSVWQLHAQGIFDMGELLHLAPRQSFSNEGVHDSASSCSVLPHASVRGLHWLPGTADFTQSYPLLAVLYAAPTVYSCHIDDASGPPPEPCLDSLAVCYLKEEGPGLSAATALATATPQKAPPILTGRLLVGPWSVRGLSLAHPQFLFATALTGRRSPPSRSSPGVNKQCATVPAATVPSAAQLFRSVLHSCADAPTAVLGVFQRPAQAPYAASSLFRSFADAVSACGHRARTLTGARFPDGDGTRLTEVSHLGRASTEQEDNNALGNSKVFAFVLYSRDGEVARCILDGYIEDAQTTWLDTYTMPTYSGRSPHAIGDQRGRGSEESNRTIARVCAFLSEKTPTQSAQTAQWHSAVVITIQARWTRAPPVVAERRHGDKVRTNGGTGASEHWSFSLQISQRLRSSAGLGGSPSHSWCATPLAMVGRILCWRFADVSGDVCCLVCGYATTPYHSDATADEVDAQPHTLVEGVFELWLNSSVMGGDSDGSCSAAVTHATRSTLDVAARAGVATSQASAAIANICPWAVSRCMRVVPPPAFSYVLHKASTADTHTTAFDLLSHTPTFSVAAARLGATVSDSVVPVALAWVAGEVHDTGVESPARAVSPLPGIAPVSRSSLLSCVRQLDVVALLRSGDVVGWRCARQSSAAAANGADHIIGDGVVLHLGAICCSLGHDTTPSLKQLFLESLLNRGAGADAVHMEVVTVPVRDGSRRVGHRQTSACLPQMETDSSLPASAVTDAGAKSTVFLVLAVGSLVGVVDLAAGAVVVVQDLRADVPDLSAREDSSNHSGGASLATADGGNHATASVLRLQRLPVASPCGWMADGDATQQGAGAAVGTSWYFLWVGAGDGQWGHSSVTVVLRLSFLCWTDVVVAYLGSTSSSAAGGATPAASALDTGPSPLPLVALQVDSCWQDEIKPPAHSSVASSVSTCATPHYLSVWHALDSAAASVGWLSCVTACADKAAGLAEPRGTGTNVGSEASSTKVTNDLPFLCVCDARLLRSLWPAMSTDEMRMPANPNGAPPPPLSSSVVPRCRPPLRFLRWGGVMPQPSLPSSCFLSNRVGATCTMEEMTGGVAASGLGMPLRSVFRGHLGESCDANASSTLPERDRNIDPPHRLTCRQVLYVSTLVLDVRSDEKCDNESEPVPHESTVSGSPPPVVPRTHPAYSSSDTASWYVLLCTLLLHKGEQTSNTNSATRTCSSFSATFDADAVAASAAKIDWKQSQAVSYLVCAVPTRGSVLPSPQEPDSAATTHSFHSFTWHWIPIYVTTSVVAPNSGGGVPQQQHVPLAVTRVLPLPRRSSAELSSTAAVTLIEKNGCHAVTPCSYFYCEGKRCSSGAAAAPHGQQACYVLRIEGDRLRRLLKRSAVVGATEAFEQVYMYTTVDPDLVRAVGV
ncbi:hypothetical protein, conserved [Leishmania tarentolae]|uniref:Uncharacterized protein n=1 Tax=Leishmania tarentolae TaxID=5689 RepID=A0A640KH54_LEITA|nr:hypothetical protein, conserved [Leishmania tarentolae]